MQNLVYAQLNSEDLVIGISHLKDETGSNDMILINEEVQLFSKYNRITGEFTPPAPLPQPDTSTPQPDPTETIEEKLTRLEQMIQTDNLTTFDVLATMYEEIGTNTMTQFEVMATMYEEILGLREEMAQLKGGTNT